MFRCEILLSQYWKVVKNTQGSVSTFVFLNRKGGLRKNKTWKGFRRDSEMINGMKNKTSDERWKHLELFAAFTRGRAVTINDLTERMAASGSQPERICKRREGEKKVPPFTGPQPFTGPTAPSLELSYARPGTSLKPTPSDGCVSSTFSFCALQTLRALGHVLNSKTGHHGVSQTREMLRTCFSMVKKGNVRYGKWILGEV